MRFRLRFRRAGVVGVILVCMFSASADWPQYRADALRSAYTGEELADRLAAAWQLQYAPPDPAWQGDDTRMDLDHACQLTVTSGMLLFGSSADCAVHAHDAATGEHRWSFTTDAPVRFAPAVCEGRVYAVSDDGFLYCLALDDGALLWKRRGGPEDRLVLGNDRLIARWPARGAPVISGGVLYWAAGIWPSEGIFIYACDPATGEPLWVNDDSGGLEMDQPHGGARAKSGVSAQGYLTLAENILLVPTGRAVPAGFNLKNGELLYFHLQEYRPDGGAELASTGGAFVNNGVLFDTATGEAIQRLQNDAFALTPDYALYVRKSILYAVKAEAFIEKQESIDRKGKPTIRKGAGQPEWELALPGERAVEMIAAGDKAIIGLDNGAILMADTRKQEIVWQGKVDGMPMALAAAGGRLYASTNRGNIYCFENVADGEARKAKPIARTRTNSVSVPNEIKQYARKVLASESAIAEFQNESKEQGPRAPWMGFANGYCADLGCGDGALACELAIRSGMKVYAIDSDPAMVEKARERARTAGLYGTRVTVLLRDPTNSGLPNAFADLVVSGRAVSTGEAPCSATELERILRPYGGMAYFGEEHVMVRGIPENVGEWTHQYCTPANPACSEDTVARSPLELLWFRDCDFEMPSRHGRGHVPLFTGGRLFVEGLHGLRAVNGYNGRTLWEYPLPGIQTAFDQEHLVGTAATNSNFCTDGAYIYIHTPQTCLVLDAATGRKQTEYTVPGGGVWGYIAVEDGILFGSEADTGHIVKWAYQRSDMKNLYTQSKRFFALDARTGELKWTYEPEHSIRHNAIAIGAGKVFLIDMPLAEGRRTAGAGTRRGR